MAEVMSPIISDRIWALPISGPAVKFLQYLIFRSEFGGELPVKQEEMAKENKITKANVCKLLKPLCSYNIVLRPESERRQGNSYRLHPLAAKYESPESMEMAFRQALASIKAGDLPNLLLPSYAHVPPEAEGAPRLHVA